MAIPIKIKITEKVRKLDDLSRGDTLLFSNRQETVVVIDKEKGRLYTKRTRGNAEETVLYQLEKVGDSYVFNNKTEGYVNSFKRIGK